MRKVAAATSFILAGLAVLAATPAWASNIYTVEYEGNVLPEQEPGWYRVWYDDPMGGGGAMRTIETDPDDPNNKFLVINTLADPMICDWAQYGRQMDPDGADEVFRAEWRILVAEHYGFEEQGVGFISDNDHLVSFVYGYDSIYCGVDQWSMPIEPGVFHTYRFESSDMYHYTLWLDGQEAHSGLFWQGLPYFGHAYFGDSAQGGGARSVVKYDYVRFGVYQVPESASFGSLLGLGVLLRRRRSIGAK